MGKIVGAHCTAGPSDMDVSSMFDDRKTIGFGLTGFGLFFMFLGVMMLFDRALLAMGNVLFLAGTITIIGAERTYAFFFQRARLRGTACFFIGIAIVLYGHPVIGMLIEMFGFVNLFGNFFPVRYGLHRAYQSLATRSCCLRIFHQLHT